MAGSGTMEAESEQQLVSVTEEPDQPGSEQPEIQVDTEQEEIHDQTEPSENQVQTTDQSDRLLKLPLSRIKNIIKMDPDVTLASQEAVVILSKAAELFISAVSKDASFKTLQAKRKTLLRKDLEHILDTRDCYAFLEGTMES